MYLLGETLASIAHVAITCDLEVWGGQRVSLGTRGHPGRAAPCQALRQVPTLGLKHCQQYLVFRGAAIGQSHGKAATWHVGNRAPRSFLGDSLLGIHLSVSLSVAQCSLCPCVLPTPAFESGDAGPCSSRMEPSEHPVGAVSLRPEQDSLASCSPLSMLNSSLCGLWWVP